jgi:hypothetical protein
MAHDSKEMADKPDKQEPAEQRDDYDEDAVSHDRGSEAGRLQQAWEEAQYGTSRPIPPMPRPTSNETKREKK